MSGLAEAIEAAVRAAYLGWTAEEPPSSRGPIGSVIPRPARLVPWSEIVASMEAATDISEQVREELDRTVPEPAEPAMHPGLRPMSAPRPSPAACTARA